MAAMRQLQMSAAGYIRVSTDTQAKVGESLNIQRQAIRAKVSQLGLRLGKVYEDAGVSGRTSKDRPALQRMLVDARAGKFQTVIVHRLSRLGRNTRDLHNIIAELQEHGVALVSIKEQLDLSTPAGRVLFTMLSAIAEFEREVIHEQMTENRWARTRRGEIFPGKPPFGYRWNREEKCLEIIPEEAPTIRRLFQLYLEGHGLEKVAYLLFREGWRSRNGNPIGSTQVAYILVNPIYAGRAEFIRNPEHWGKRKSKMGPESELVTMPAPPIISAEDWERVSRELVDRRGHDTKPALYSEQWLRNSLRCGVCGGKVVPQPWGRNVRKDGTRPRRYFCRWTTASAIKREMQGRSKCTLPLLDAEALEDDVWVRVLLMIRRRRGLDWSYRESVKLLADDLATLAPPERQVLMEVLLEGPIEVIATGHPIRQWELGPIRFTRDIALVEQRLKARADLPIGRGRFELLDSLAYRVFTAVWRKRRVPAG